MHANVSQRASHASPLLTWNEWRFTDLDAICAVLLDHEVVGSSLTHRDGYAHSPTNRRM